jgi:hypothetical protein
MMSRVTVIRVKLAAASLTPFLAAELSTAFAFARGGEFAGHQRRLSALGQTRKSGDAIAISALPLRADITRTLR